MKRFLCILTALFLLMSFIPAHAEENVCPILYGSDYFPLAEPITLTALAINTPGQISVSNSYVLDWIKEKTNITLEITHELYGSEGESELSLMMASGEKLPDILFCTRWSKAECALYGAQGLVIPLDEYLKDCVNWNRLNDICGPAHADDLTMSDGNIYCFGSVNECFHLTHQARMWVYQPWIDLLCDGRLPQTTEEFQEYLFKVATMDPNGNGLADEIPLSGQIDNGWASDPFTFLSNSFVHNNRIFGSSNEIVAAGVYLSPDGQVHCNWIEDGYREALRYMNTLYQQELLDQRAFMQDVRQLEARLFAKPHLVGAIPSGGIPERYMSGAVLSENDNWALWTCLPPLQGPEGVRLSYQSRYNYFYNCNGLVTRDCAYPEIAVQLFDFLSSTEGTLVQNYGQEGLGWFYCEPGQGVGLDGSPALYQIMEGSNTANAWPPDMHISSNFHSFRKALMVSEDVANNEKMLWDAAATYHPYSPGTETVFPNLAFSHEQSVDVTMYASTIDTYVEQATVQFIIGTLNVDKDWTAYLSMLESLGQSKYQQLLQQAYDAAVNQ